MQFRRRKQSFILLTLLITSFVILQGVVLPTFVFAIPVELTAPIPLTVMDPPAEASAAVSAAKSILTVLGISEGTAQSIVNTVKDINNFLDKWSGDELLGGAFKAALGVFLNQLAQDTAVWIASGDNGQKPLFFRKGWGPYLTQLADQALGEFVYTAGRALDQKLSEKIENTQLSYILYDEEMRSYNNELEQEIKDCGEKYATPIEVQRCNENSRRELTYDYLFQNLITDEKNKAQYDACLDIANNTADGNIEGGITERERTNCQTSILPSSQALIGSAGSAGFRAGEILGSLASSIARDVCAPSSPEVALKITYALKSRRLQPRCTFSQIRDRFQRGVVNPLFAQDFIQYFQSGSNDISIALDLWDKQLEEEANAKLAGLYERSVAGEFKAKKDPVSGYTNTPGNIVKYFLEDAIGKDALKETTFTGTLADAIATFINTLAGQLLDKIGRKGLVRGGDDDSPTRFGSESLFSFSSSPGSAGIAGAKLRFADFRKVDFSGGGVLNILNLLTQCRKPDNPGPTECVITDNFRDAVIEGLTVRQAIESGNLDGDLPLGFTGDGLEPSYKEGYPYRSLLILRKYRIIPVGWELAALYVKHFGKETVSLRSVMENYDNIDSAFYRLVDPNWVLKAPENFCSVKGPGPQIVTEQVLAGNDSNDDGDFLDEGDRPPQLRISRDTNYCGNEKSCLETNRDGSCKFFGYCTKDKPVWNFQGDECEPLYNTCASFQDRKGATVAYLKNTLEFNGCSVDNAGCQAYCEDQDPASRNFLCTDTAGEKQYFDRDAKTCPENAAGCRKYFSIAEGSGANIIPNGSFEEYKGIIDDAFGDSFLTNSGFVPENHFAVSEAFIGNVAALLSPDPGTQMTLSGDTGLALRGRTFVFSLAAKGCSDGTTFGFVDTNPDKINGEISGNADPDSNWERFSIAYRYRESSPETAVSVFVKDPTGSNCKIDAAMVEEGEALSGYRDYNDNPSLFLKTAPENFVCSTTNPNRPSSCDNFTLSCTAEEVGCALYKPLKSGSRQSLPAVARESDYCPSECVGYDTFKQEATFFENSVFPQYFIPETAGSCSANNAGCDEFTNLDEVARGGEGREYYKYIRQCVKTDSGGVPVDASASCGTFFSWVGTEETGYQLVTHSLEQAGGEPAIIAKSDLMSQIDLGPCDDAEDAINNPECRQYFNESGEVSYKLWRLTRTCSETCVPYRKTGANEADCNASGGEWQAGESYCLYNAVPQEGLSCSAEAAGCRAYTGSSAKNIRVVFSEDFEDGTTAGWQTGFISNESITAAGHSITSDSNVSGSPVLNEIRTDVGFVASTFTPGKTYEISFWAKAAKETSYISMVTSPDSTFDFESPALNENRVTAGTQWNLYTIGPFTYDPTGVADPQTLFLRFTGSNVSNGGNSRFFLDTIKVTEIRQNIYLKKGSWKTPLSCDNLINDPYGSACAPASPGPGDCAGTPASPCRCSGPEVTAVGPFTSVTPYHLGCAVYQGPKGQVNLSSFTNLCREEAVGCEALVDTENSSIPYDQVANAVCTASSAGAPCTPTGFTDPVCTAGADGTCNFTFFHSASVGAVNFGLDENTVVTPADNVKYIVNNPRKSCLESEMGCRALGKEAVSTSVSGSPAFTNSFILDRPDDYEQILCTSDAVWCEEFKMDTGFSYFKDPRGNVCEWRLPTSETSGEKAWYKKKTSPTERDVPCPFVDTKTLGLGGVSILTPSIDSNKIIWAGACPVASSSCMEYIDPLSDSEANLIFNGDFNQNVVTADIPDGPDGWENTGGAIVSYSGGVVTAIYAPPQIFSSEVALQPNTLYTISGVIKKVGDENAVIGISGSIASSPDASMVVSGNSAQLIISNSVLDDANSREFSGRFKTGIAGSLYNVYAGAYGGSSGHEFESISIRQTNIYYNLETSLDKSSCSGVVDAGDGCVLFNERDVIGDNLTFKPVTFDADLSDRTPEIACTNDSGATLCDSNTLIKVRPDRECAEWLTCRSSVQTTTQTGEVKDECLDIGLCTSIDPDTGACNQMVVRGGASAFQNITLNKSGNSYTLDLASRFSGLSKVGIQYNSTLSLIEGYLPPLIEGYLPLDEMTQIGQYQLLENGSFELYSKSGQPVGWAVKSGKWSSDQFRVIADPATAQTELGRDRNRAPEGVSFLRVGSTFSATSEYLEVSADNDYVISGFINTANLESGNADIRVEEYKSDGTQVGLNFDDNDSKTSNLPYLPAGSNWEFKVAKIHTSDTTTRIRLRLVASAGAGAVGSFYYDDVRVSPALEVQRNLNPADPDANAYCVTSKDGSTCNIASSCRLYPESGSFSCEYFDQNGIKIKGWPGYCLERDPKNLNSCLSWWPVDRIIGDSIDDVGAGYTDRAPLYMCLNVGVTEITQTLRTDEAAPECASWKGNCECGASEMPVVIPSSPLEDAVRITAPEKIKKVVAYFKGESTADIFDPLELNPVPSPADGKKGYCWVYEDISRNGQGTVCNYGDCSDPFPDDKNITPRDFNSTFVDTDGITKRRYPTCNSNTECSSGSYCVAIWTAVAPDIINEMSWEGSLLYDIENKKWWAEFLGEDGRSSCDSDTAFKRLGGSVEVSWTEDSSICTDIAQVVTASGKNTAWTGRLSPGSSYILPGGQSIISDDINMTLKSDFQPFGGVVPPEPVSIPSEWDGKKSVCINPAKPWRVSGTECPNNAGCTGGEYTYCAFIGKDALNIESPDLSNFPTPPHQVRAGTPYSCSGGADCPIGLCLGTLNACISDLSCELSVCCTPGRGGDCDDLNKHPFPLNYTNSTDIVSAIDRVKRIFARSFGTWQWDGAQYSSSNDNWNPPDVLCEYSGANERPPFGSGNDLCGVAPVVENVKASTLQAVADTFVDNTGFVALTFTSDVDFNQLPLTRIKLNWGDGQTSVISGARMRDQTNPLSPHRFFHLYSYWQLKGKDLSADTILCDAVKCEVQVRVQVKDNWGWCNASGAEVGLYGANCDTLLNAWTEPITIEVRQ